MRKKTKTPKRTHPPRRRSASAALPPPANPAASACPVVGIGASAGGIEALKQFFEKIPPESGLAFVIIQHLDPTHKSYMRDVLSRFTPLRVVEPADGTAIEPNVVYTIPPNTYLAVHNCTLTLSPPVKRAGLRMPIDFFFRSLAADLGEKAIGVVLSGSGSDGTLGMREIRGAGGMVIVQDPATAMHDGMPQNAIFTGLVDHVLPAQHIPAALLAYVRGAFGERNALERTTDEKPDVLNAILALVAARTKSDFRSYKKTTVRRRIQRQMGLHQVDTLPKYLELLRAHPEKVTQLAKDMLIGVTSFFRDPDSFEELRTRVIVPLIREHQHDGPLRAWVPGCATGEEAYSLAMLLLEEVAAAPVPFPVQIFASDIDEEALKIGRVGVYPDSIASDVSEERLERFFTKVDRAYQVNKEVRDAVTFAAQNLISDPPFSRLDVISCRNLLIYLESDMQKRVHALFAYGLKPGGYLFLGKSDGVAGYSEFFDAIFPRLRIFRRTGSARPELNQFPLAPAERRLPVPRVASDSLRPRGSGLAHLSQQALLAQYDAALVLVRTDGTILHFVGNTGKYVEHPTGDASLNLLQMTREVVSIKLASALRDAATGQVVTLDHLPLIRSDTAGAMEVTIRPIENRQGDNPVLAVIFEETRSEHLSIVPDVIRNTTSAEAAYADLIAELSGTKEDLQATIEELETSNEELKAANEEVTSVNEELQSTNEELETSKEELQSVNEELTTVNQQMQEKVDELSNANSDLANLFSATDVATIFLDPELRIRRFTPATTALMRLVPTDIGRPIAHILHDVVTVNLAAEATRVLRVLGIVEKEVKTRDRRRYLMRVLPFRTLADKIDGVVVTFYDVTARKHAEQALSTAQGKLEKHIGVSGAQLTKTRQALQVETQRREDLSLQLMRIQDEERQRIARELHDTTAQNLAGLGMNLALIERSAKTLAPKARKALAESTELIQAVLREVRTISYLLHPPLLEQVGLVSAVRWYVDGFAQRSGIHVRLRLPGDLGRLPLRLKSVIFRVIQESLTNIHLHSGSTQAAIRVQTHAGQIVVSTEDAGKGFPRGLITAAGAVSSKVGTGLASMRERVHEIGGTLHVETKPGRTVITATIPLKKGAQRSRSAKNVPPLPRRKRSVPNRTE